MEDSEFEYKETYIKSRATGKLYAPNYPPDRMLLVDKLARIQKRIEEILDKGLENPDLIELYEYLFHSKSLNGSYRKAMTSLVINDFANWWKDRHREDLTWEDWLEYAGEQRQEMEKRKSDWQEEEKKSRAEWKAALEADRKAIFDNLPKENTSMDSIADNKDWDFFLNTENEGVAKYPDFVLRKKKYFETGEGKGVFGSLEFMNLFHRQWLFFHENVDKPVSTIAALNGLPLSSEQRRILFTSIIELYGWTPNDSPYLQHEIAMWLLAKEITKLSAAQPEDETVYKYDMKDVAGCAAENDWDYYYNVKNIPKNELVRQTISYFQTGERKGYIEPLAFLNLLWKQHQFVNDNIGRPHSIIITLQGLEIDDELRHVLFYFILRWFGCTQYPAFNRTPQYDTALKLIEDELMNYAADTPEKSSYRPPEPELEIVGNEPKITEPLAANLHQDVMSNVNWWQRDFENNYNANVALGGTSADDFLALEIENVSRRLEQAKNGLLESKDRFIEQYYFSGESEAKALANNKVFKYYTIETLKDFCEKMYFGSYKQLWQPFKGSSEGNEYEIHCEQVLSALFHCRYFRNAANVLKYQKHLASLEQFSRTRTFAEDSTSANTLPPATQEMQNTDGLIDLFRRSVEGYEVRLYAKDLENAAFFDTQGWLWWQDKREEARKLALDSATVGEALAHLKKLAFLMEEQINAHNVTSPRPHVYIGKDTALCNWLQNKELKPLQNTIDALAKLQGIYGDTPLKPVPQNSVPSQQEVALLYVYLNKPINKNNCAEVGTREGCGTSEKLYQHYARYSIRQNRIAPEQTEKKTKNKIALMEKVCNRLPESCRDMVTDEIKLLTANL